MAQLVKGLTSKYKALSSKCSTAKKRGGRREEKEKKNIPLLLSFS
jgi:hypothetical protein